MNDRTYRAEHARNRARMLAGQSVMVVSAPTLYPTPCDVAVRVHSLASIEPGMTVLEPSAGTGALLEDIPEDCIVTAVEIDRELCSLLSSRFPNAEIKNADFLSLRSEPEVQFQRIIMNPPFTNGIDISHIQHAFSFLAPGGRLVALCANGPRQQRAFTDAVLFTGLPAGSFLSQGTNVNTAIVLLVK